MPSTDSGPPERTRLRTKIAVIIGITLFTIALICITKQFDPTRHQDISSPFPSHSEIVATPKR